MSSDDDDDDDDNDAITTKASYFSLKDGKMLPKIGLGVYRSDPGTETYQTVRWALEVGYRCVDTAAMYENEHDVGRAVADSGVPRDQVFLTTKLDTDSHGYHMALHAAEDCLRKLQTPYIDLLLIHSPYGEKIVETWDALLELQVQGKAKSVGVSNFGVPHLEALREHGRPMPSINQFELHPLNYQKRRDLVHYCEKHKIQITAYGSLFSGETDRWQHPLLQSLAEKYDKTVPQILLRWALDQGFAIIPKSTSSKQRLEENYAVVTTDGFSLLPEEVDKVSNMKGKPLDEYWDPVTDAEVDIGDLEMRDTHHWG